MIKTARLVALAIAALAAACSKQSPPQAATDSAAELVLKNANIYTVDDLEETSPAKRLQNSQGEAITIPPPRRPLKFNAQRLLNHLAFTRLSLTANFSKFNPASSFIILCMVSEQNELYHALW